MSKTETSGVPTATEGLSLTVPSDAAPVGTHAHVIHTPVAGAASAPLSTPVSSCGPAAPAMPDVPSTRGVQVTSADDV